MKLLARQGETLDALCFRTLGQTAGVVEKALDLNSGLAEMGTILAHGTLVELPDMIEQPKKLMLQLWD
ncbi:tail protein X [Arsenophonus apicola]|uniref:Tail protein X n=1 Tax=Arsenophonus apicola TaxID=2879119 RepID=A0ABY8P7Z4_9GAMM|nr:tail protein X [Arsenophonus apicola]WGO84679.1 tail protein X [Arsenophonus apicola]